MQKYPLNKAWEKEAHLVESELKTNLGNGNKIFVGSSTDMWGEWIPDEWITKVLNYCNQFDNEYLFQSKDPRKFLNVKNSPNFTFCVTQETNILAHYDNWPYVQICRNRLDILKEVKAQGKRIAVTIEPIMNFDNNFAEQLIELSPEWIAIGANTSTVKLPEPSSNKIVALIEKLTPYIKLHLKDNLKRLLNV